jgi:hypothetical protein
MTDLATLNDVEASLLRELTSAEATFVPTLLARASREVRVYTGQFIEEVEDDEVTITADMYGNLRLPQIPVTAVASVVVAGTTLDPADYQWDAGGMITRPTFNSFEINGAIGLWSGDATVIYTHGYSRIPDDVSGIVADVVAARINTAQPSGGTVKSAAVDDVRVEYDTTATANSVAGLTDTQKRILDRYKQPARALNMISRRVP